MNAKEVKHMARLEEWKEKVSACRSSGLPVRRWCREQGIANKTYYYWERAVQTEAAGHLATVESSAGNRFVEVAALPERRPGTEAKPELAAKLRTGMGELEVYAGADAAALAALVWVLKDAE